MNKREQIREAFRKMAAHEGPVQTKLVQVTSVDEDEMTCIVLDDDIEINDVRLRNVLNDKESISIIPKINSWVLMQRLEEDEDWMVVAVDEIDKYRIVCGEMVFEMFDGKFLIQNGGENLGKCLDDLITQIQAIYAPKNTASITAIQTRLKTFLSGT
jgi:hypothetical protein